MSEPDKEYVAAAAVEAVGALIHKIDEGAFPMKFVLLIEVADADGEQPMWVCAPPDAKPSDTLGLLTYALHLEQSYTIADTLGRQ